MCDECSKKADEIAELARRFRDHAAEARLPSYAQVMAETAEALENLSRHFAQRCRRGEDPSEQARVFAQSDSRLLERSWGDLYWRR